MFLYQNANKIWDFFFSLKTIKIFLNSHVIFTLAVKKVTDFFFFSISNEKRE